MNYHHPSQSQSQSQSRRHPQSQQYRSSRQYHNAPSNNPNNTSHHPNQTSQSSSSLLTSHQRSMNASSANHSRHASHSSHSLHHTSSKMSPHQNRLSHNKDLAHQEKEFIKKSTSRIVELAGIQSKSDTADLISRSVKQHLEYLRRVQNHEKIKKQLLLNGGSNILSQDIITRTKIMDYIQQLTELENREQALTALSKLRENNRDLAPLLWGTPAVIAALLQEVISVYPYLSGNIDMNSNHSNRCCNALALLQCVASHPETRGLFLKAYIPLFLYPFLNTELNSRPFEYLRLTSLGVIGALVKHPHPNINNNNSHPNVNIIPDSEVTEFLVKTEAIPLCLHIMEYGNELSQTVATFIIQKILLDDYGLNYVCKTSDRFFAISQVLTKMIQEPNNNHNNKSKDNNDVKGPSKKLIKHVVRCYLRLCDDTRAFQALHSVLPKYLQSNACDILIGDDESCLSWLRQLRIKHVKSKQEQNKRIQQRQQQLLLQQQQQQQQQQQGQQQQQPGQAQSHSQQQRRHHHQHHSNIPYQAQQQTHSNSNISVHSFNSNNTNNTNNNKPQNNNNNNNNNQQQYQSHNNNNQQYQISQRQQTNMNNSNSNNQRINTQHHRHIR